MAKRHGCTVDVLIDGEPQRIYDDPSPERNSKPKESTYYVEAITDAVFGIKLTVGRGFKLMGANCIGIEAIFDGQRMGYYVLTKKDLRDPTGCYLIMDSSTVYDPQTSKWRAATFCFGSLTVLESTDVDTDPKSTENLGKIQINVQRVMRRKRSTRARAWSPDEEEFKTVSEVTEKSLKGKAIENAVRPILTGYRRPPGQSSHVCQPIEGSKGEEMQFNILYRSKRALKTLGCIPRTPSPDPEPVVEEDRTSDAEAGKVEQIQALRAQLAVLEQGINVKPERSRVDDILIGASYAHSITRVKRERNGEVEFLGQKRLRTSEVIDLTDD